MDNYTYHFYGIDPWYNDMDEIYFSGLKDIKLIIKNIYM